MPVRKDAIDVYFERKKVREFVGRLFREKGKFVFCYNFSYLRKENIVSLGPDIPLTKQRHTSSKLFPSFFDRIPSRENPAYKEYCEWMGIDVNEQNPFILLATIGRKGPSSFIFAPILESGVSPVDVKKFRQNLGLSIREFADIFDFAPATIYRIENNKTSGKDALKRIELYLTFPRRPSMNYKNRFQDQ